MWTPPNISDLPNWSDHKRVSVDCETHDPQLKKLGCGAQRDGQMVGYSFAMDGKAYYVPLRHEEGGNVDVAQGLAYLRDQFASFTGDIVGANLSYDLRYLTAEGVDYSRVGSFRDVQIAAPLLDENQEHYSLQAIAKRMGFEGKDETLLNEEAARRKLNPKSDMWRLHSKWVGEYAEKDALLPLQLIEELERDIEKQQLQKVYRLECDLLPVLLKMMLRGIRINEPYLDELEAIHLAKRDKAIKDFNYDTGLSLSAGDLNKNRALGKAMDALGISYPLTAKSGDPEITSAFLLGSGRDELKLLDVARKSNKILGTFIQSIRSHAINGRIHASFNQLRRISDWGSNNYGTVSGRLSCTNPNMQQQPSSKDWRKLYIPEDGEELLSVDYSSQELRIAVHYALRTKDRSALSASKAYKADPKADLYQLIADVVKVDRKVAKTVVLGTMYGMGAGNLARQLGMKVNPDKKSFVNEDGETIVYYEAGEEAQAILNKIHGRFPWMKNLKEYAKHRVNQFGYIKSIMHRRCRFPQRFSGSHKALNRLIQSSAADQMKKALVDLDNAGIKTLASIHDEIVCSISDRTDATLAGEIMTNAIPLQVPVVVDAAIGRSWGEMEEV